MPDKDDISVLVFYVNGKRVEDDNVNPEWTLLYYLRNKLHLCGAKLGCAEGGCGACTVMVSKFDRRKDTISHFPVNACLAPVCSMHGLAVTTVEGIGSTKTKLHPVQERIAKAHGSQCGFCTPGIVMSMYTLLRNTPKPSMKNLDEIFQGNLCRCTGYRPIIEAYKTFTTDYEIINSQRNGCCKGNTTCCQKEAKTACQKASCNQDTRQRISNGCCKKDENSSQNKSVCCKKGTDFTKNNSEAEQLFEPSKFIPFDPSQEPIFPPELKLDPRLDKQNLYFKGDFVTWHRPNTLQQLLELKSKHPEAKIVVGNTEIGVEVKFKNQNYPILIQPGYIHEMFEIEVMSDGIKIGACVNLDYLNEFLQKIDLPEDKNRIFVEIKKMLNYFAGKQIRSVASIGGNIMTGSPISDLNPILMAAEVDLYTQSIKTVKVVKFNEDFYTGYRRNILEQDEILIAVKIPFTHKNQFFKAYKQARRRDDDIAIVNAAFNFVLSEDLTITQARLVFGGVAPITKSAVNTSCLLKGKKWNEQILNTINSSLLEELHLQGDAPGGMVEYRKALPLSFFYKTYIYITLKLQTQNEKSIDLVKDEERSALSDFEYKPPQSAQFFQVSQNTLDPVGKPVIHSSALKQATGEAIYFDDLPYMHNEIYMAFVYTTKSHALIKSIDFSKALKLKGVIGYISAQDVKEGKKLGPVHQDEDLFVKELVLSQNQLVAAVVAENELLAKKAARLVEVQYQELQPVIVSIEDAIKHGSFFDVERKLSLGDVDAGFEEADHVLEGECRTGYQEHFYLETHGCLVMPKEGDFEIFSSSQHHAEITDFVSRTLEIPQHRIVTRIKRIGGGFGGKQSRGVPVAVATTLAAKKFNRPVRIMLDRNEDMASTGGRHPYYMKYKVGFKNDGRIIAYDAQLFANGGFSSDLSIEVLERAVFHIENTYKLPNIRVTGKICKTNLPTNTAFRGFGAPQSMFAAENMIRDVAEFLKEDPVKLALMHLYKEGDITHYNQKVENCNLKSCIDECLSMSKYYERKAEIEIYNKNNRWKKRGISLVSTKYGVGFGVPMLEQAGALVIIYTDGSVLITHSGVEMGQGLNIKMIQVASRVLEIPTDIIYISECATDKVPNTSPTAASVGSDLNGMAVMRACKKLKDRLKPVIEKNPNGKWKDWILTAYLGRVSLQATGYYATPDIEYNWETNTGKPYNYYTYGASCSEVEIDCLTGDHQVLRTDIVMDIGNSLNPAIDIGQIEGGFMQGYGLFVMEEMVYSPIGTIYSKGPGAYKIPGFNDIPVELNVSLLKGVSNPRAVYSSKAVGEPPLFLASSTLFAIREAVKYARADAGKPTNFRLNAPATAEKIRMACEDSITDSTYKTKDSRTPWNVIP